MMNVSIKLLGVNFGNPIPDNSKWDKINDGIAKKNTYLEQSETLIAVADRPNLYYSKIYQKGTYDFL